jgi:hypothetical protein
MKKLVLPLAVLSLLVLSSGLAFADTLTLSVAADTTFAGNPGSLLHEVFQAPGEPEEVGDLGMFEEAGFIRIYGLRFAGESWNLFPPASYLVPVSSMTVGQTWSWLPGDSGGSTTATVETIESVTVPAGTFTNAYRVDIRSDALPSPSTPTESYWFVSGVGYVRQEAFFPDGSSDYFSELVSFTGSGTGFLPREIGNVWIYDEQVSGGPTAVGDTELPTRATLQGAYPNPFNPMTRIAFEMVVPGVASLRIYDASGRLVTTLSDEHRDAGRHEVVWNGRDQAGRMSSAGVYLYRLESGDYHETKRVTLVK